ncbi:hypothetical protein DY000_02044510 [Brassica cretica]|uniref:Uncharacterized protein n=1 Tax=Brassica cretica TaxID=69181 RepID=A0ABQ7F974_BRACR|nr:hypothetical protein DY000_02044510 [Brassica cretica]
MSRAEIAKKLRRLVVGDDVPLREPLHSYPHSGHENGTGHRPFRRVHSPDMVGGTVSVHLSGYPCLLEGLN